MTDKQPNPVFGPVSSRRLGRSLGVDPVPFKTCNFSCVYCQLGRTTHYYQPSDRQDFLPLQQILTEAEQVLAKQPSGSLDVVTVVGSGEPTLYASLQALIGSLKRLSGLPVAVITNGSLLHLPSVREDLLQADIVLPSLDAGSAALFRRICRPHKSFDFERHLAGLSSFRELFRGQLWIEVMLVKGLNDTEDALADLAGLLSSIQPDEVHLLVPNRPPAESFVKAPDAASLTRAQEVLGSVARVVAPVRQTKLDFGDRYSDVADAILNIVSRHPVVQEELIDLLQQWKLRVVNEALDQLEQEERVQSVMRNGKRFWSSTSAVYEEENG